MIAFVSSVRMVDSKPFDSFVDAVKDFIARIADAIQSGDMTLLVLEQACWIQRVDGQSRMVLKFYDVKELAIKLGILAPEDGIILPTAKEPAASTLKAVFLIAAGNNGDASAYIRERVAQ